MPSICTVGKPHYTECFSLIKTKKQIKYRKGNLDLADPSEVHDERCVSQWNAVLYH